MPIIERPMFDKHKEARRKWERTEFHPRFAAEAYGTDKELHSLFIRIRRDVNFKGAFTPADVDERLREGAEELRLLAKRGYLRPARAKRGADNLDKLAGTNFAPTVIAMARRHPYGVENLTMNYGNRGAADIILERDRRLRRMMRTKRD